MTFDEEGLELLILMSPLMPAIQQVNVNVIVYPEDGVWIAQCLEIDISCQAKTPNELYTRLMKNIAANLAISTHLGKNPLSIGPAPKKFWQMFEQSKMRLQGESLPMRAPDAIPEIKPTLKLADMALCA